MKSARRYSPFARPPVAATVHSIFFTPPSQTAILSLANSAPVLIEEYFQKLSVQEHVEDYSMVVTVAEVNVSQDSSTVAAIIGKLEENASSWEYTMTPFDNTGILPLEGAAACEL